MGSGEIIGFAGIDREVVEFPCFACLGLYGTPISLTDGGPSTDFPIQILVLLLRGFLTGQLGQKRKTIDVSGRFGTRGLGDGGQDVGKIAEVIADNLLA